MSTIDENAVVVDVTYQLTPAAHKPLPYALYLSFLLVVTPPPLPSPSTLPTSFLPSSHKYFIYYIPSTLHSYILHIHYPAAKTFTKKKKQ